MDRLKKTTLKTSSLCKDLSNYLIIILSFFICQGLGRYSEALIAFSFLALVSIFLPRLKTLSILGFISVISLVAMTSQPFAWSTLIPFAAIWITRQCLREKTHACNLFIFIASLFAAIFLSSLTDRDWVTFFLLLASISAPIFRIKELKKTKKSNSAALILFFCIASISFVFYQRIPQKRVAYLKSGVWAKTQEKLNTTTNLNMATMYAYSELVELLQASNLEIDNLEDGFGEAWVVIPTTPFTEDQKEKILSWVNRGGRLILVTDHTDLFGHATIINDLLAKLNARTQTDAFFPQDPTSSAQVSLHKDIPLKTANSQTGWFLWPTMTAKWVSEPVDYSNRNFFGPMRATGTTNYERRVISGAISHGKGQIILFGDSTIFANFAIYQPGIIPFLEYLRTAKTMASLYPHIIGLIILGWGTAFAFRRTSILFASSFLGLWGIMDISTIPITWPKFIPIYGDSEMLSEWASPETSFSTAYSFIPITGNKPRWSSQLSNDSYGIWISHKPPLDKKWIWVNPTSPNTDRINRINLLDDPKLNPINELLKKITKHNPIDWVSCFKHSHVDAGHVWTNDVMGEWWLDNGISKSKKSRIEAWLALIQQKPYNDTINYSIVTNPSQNQTYKLKVNGSDWESIVLPKLILEDANEEVYLGRGVSAKIVVMADGQKALLGTKSMIEGWSVASSWILIPEI